MHLIRGVLLVASLVVSAFVIATPTLAQSSEQPVYASASDLAAALTSASQAAITRDNTISLYLTQLQLAPLTTGAAASAAVRFAVVVELQLISESTEKVENYSYVVDQPVDLAPGTSATAQLASAFRTLLSSRSLLPFREIHLVVRLIRLDGEERARFSNLLGLFGSVVQKSLYGPVLDVLGITPAAAGDASKVLAFDGTFLVPTNYWSHQNARRLLLPTLSNDESVALAFQLDSPRNNTNVVSFLMNTANKVSQVVAGKSVLTNLDQVQGFAVFTFTKSQFAPLPRSLGDSLMVIKGNAESAELPSTFDAQLSNTTFLYSNLQTELPSSGRESVVTFLELAKLYRDFRNVEETEAPDPAPSLTVLKRFQAWLTQSAIRLQQTPQAGPRVSGAYPNKDGRAVFPVIIYPYGLTDPLIVSSVLWQLRIHQFVADYYKLDAGKTTRYTFSVPLPPA